MKVIIIGYGRLGSELTCTLEKQGENVTVIDNDPGIIEQMEQDVRGTCIIGVGYDKDVLEHAGIVRADAVIACTNSDESNALIARIARNIYRVPKVIARLYDERKATIYNTLGIQTISTTAWGVRSTLEMLSYKQMDTVLDIGNSEVRVVRFEVPRTLEDASIRDISRLGEVNVLAVTRDNDTFIPVHGTALRQGDILHIAVLASAAPQLAKTLGL